MCFSATASFAASGLLTALGIAALYKAKTNPMRMLAITPLFFAIQQAVEGVIWTVYHNQDMAWLLIGATYLYIFFAYIFWPTWLPLTFYILEPVTTRKNSIGCIALLGIAFSANALRHVILHGATATIFDHHVYYTSAPSISFYMLLKIIYLCLVAAPFFISTLQRAWIFGVLIIISFIATELWYPAHFTSIWCFFAAITSFLMLIILDWKTTKD